MLHIIRFHFDNILEMQNNKYEEQSDMVVVIKDKTTMELFCNLTYQCQYFDYDVVKQFFKILYFQEIK